MKNIVAIIIDDVSISLLCGLVAYSWCQFYVHSIIISVVVALIVMATCGLFCYVFSKHFVKKRNLNKQQKDNITKIYQKLQFCSKTQQMHWLKQSLKLEDNTTSHSNYFWHNHTIIYNALLDNMDKDALCKILREIVLDCDIANIKQITILCNNIEASLKGFAKTLDIKIELLDKVEAVARYNLQESTLNAPINIRCPIKNYKYFVNYAFALERTKSYLLLGLVLILSSFFVLYKIYYLVFGTFLITLAIITLLKHLKNKNSTV